MIDNIAEVLDRPSSAAADRAALIVKGEVCSYGGLQVATRRCAIRLADRGVLPGARVPVLDWGGVLAVAATLGAAHLGAAAAPMNPLLTQAELGQLAKVASCGTIGVAGRAYAGDLAGAIGGADPITADDLAGSADPVPPRVGGGEDDALVLFTSGTTGVPKAVAISHRGLAARIGEYRQAFDADRPPSVSLMCVPAFHVGGLLGLVLNLYSGDTTVVQPRFDAGEWLALVERYRVASSFLVPTMLSRILDHQRFASTDLSSLTSLAYGAAAASPALVRRAMQALPHVSFANVFGQTETLGAYTTLGPADHHHPDRVGSVGRPLADVRIRIVDPATGDDVPAGQIGELWVDAPSNVQPGWLRTGDLARQDAEGYVYPTGRLSETINRGGEKFAPMEVADVLRRHPDIVDAAVAGVPDPEMGERVGVAVVCRAGAGALTRDEIRDWCRPHLASYKLPDVVVVVDTLPYNELGKLSRRATVELMGRTSQPPQGVAG